MLSELCQIASAKDGTSSNSMPSTGMTKDTDHCKPWTEMQRIEQWSTEDRIRDAFERCLSDLGQDNPNKHLWEGVSCWCLKEFMKRNSQNVLVLLQQVLEKTKQVLEQCQYELVVPLTLLFSSALLRAPHVDCGVLQDAYLVFHDFLTWPEPYFSACKHLLNIIQQEFKAPGISFHRLIRSEQGVCPRMHSPKSVMVLLANPDGDDPLEVPKVSQQLNEAQYSNREVSIVLILHCFQAALSATYDWKALQTTLQTKQTEELEVLAEKVTDLLETAASAEDLCTARQSLLYGMERLRASLSVTPTGCHSTATVETCRILPIPKCHSCYWENDNFDFLNNILSNESSLDSLDSAEKCFPKADDNYISADEGGEATQNKADRHNVIASPSTNKSSCIPPSLSAFSILSGSSGVDIRAETTQEHMKGEHNIQLKPRKKPKKKSRSLLGVESLSFLFKAPSSPNPCRRAQSMGYCRDLQKSKYREVEPVAPLKQMCIYRRPILSCDEGILEDTSTLVKVVIFGGNREVGRLARAYCNLQKKKNQYTRLTQTCKLQFYFVPTKRSIGNPAEGNTLTGGQTESSAKPLPSEEYSGSVFEENTNEIAQMLGVKDPWYMRNVQSLFSLPSDVLCQAVGKGEDDTSLDNKKLPLLTDMVLYYCRHAEQPVLLQLYQAEMTLSGGEERKEVFIHSLELGHAAISRAFKGIGAVNKRFGIDEERKAVPLTLSVAYNKVTVSGRNQWKQTVAFCTSMNLYKVCKTLDSGTEHLQLAITEVLKKQRPKSARGYNHQEISVSVVKVNQVQVNNTEDGKTFAVCLDQDEKRFIQGVIRCEVSLCYKPISASDWRSCRPLSGQMQHLHPSCYSLLCLPINSFMASCP